MEPIEVDEPPCEAFTLSRIAFDTGEHVLADQALEDVGALGEQLRQRPGRFELEVRGHTDIRPVDGGNQLLSKRRAEAVMEALVDSGVGVGLFRPSVGFGASQLVDEAETPEAHQRNRRVEIVVFCLDDSP